MNNFNRNENRGNLNSSRGFTPSMKRVNAQGQIIGQENSPNTNDFPPENESPQVQPNSVNPPSPPQNCPSCSNSSSQSNSQNRPNRPNNSGQPNSQNYPNRPNNSGQPNSQNYPNRPNNSGQQNSQNRPNYPNSNRFGNNRNPNFNNPQNRAAQSASRNFTPNNAQVDNLVNTASKHLNTTPEELKKSAQSGDLQKLLSQMPPKQAEQIQRVLADENLTKKLLSSPQAQALLKGLQKNE